MKFRERLNMVEARMHSIVADRCDEKFHLYIRLVTESVAFNSFIMLTIFLNAITIAVDTDENLKMDFGEILEALDNTFLAVYTVEFVLKFYAEPISYWKSSYNLFDFFVLVISFVQTAMIWTGVGESRLSALRVLRALRTLRTLRTVSFIEGLQVLVTALIDTVRAWVINIIALLLLMMFVFAILGYYFFGTSPDGDKENWGTLGRAMLTLFSYVTADGWTDIQDRLDARNLVYSRIYTMVFIFMGHFIFSNVFIGVIIMNISESTEEFKLKQQHEREEMVRHKKEFMMMRQHNDVKQMMEKQRSGNYSNFHDMVEDFEKGLRHEDSTMMSDLSTNILWLETFIRTLDHMDTTMYSIQQLHFELANLLANRVESKLNSTKH
ncbi:hypothetical protein LSAT2_012532 [Lamellibrachia satsuma]|nr:hypothetical protein LSAT2_012532 [Lamellibrachia satsuma]